MRGAVGVQFDADQTVAINRLELDPDRKDSQDSGNLNPGYLSPSIDAIGEVKLLASNYTAEYGGRTGGQLTFSVKNGTPAYHGGAFYYWRHEQFNANEWINNKLNVTKPKYRMKHTRLSLTGLFCLAAGFSTLSAQSVTGQISGTLVDPTGAVIAGAEVKLTHIVSKQVITFTADSQGTFACTGLLPDDYVMDTWAGRLPMPE